MKIDENHPDLGRLRSLSRLMDDAIPVPFTKWRIGLDGLIGLIPGFGDAATGIVSLYTLYTAWRLGASRELLLRMAANVLIDALVGSVPVLGDVFDFAFRANTRNMNLIERELAPPRDENEDRG